MNLIIEITRKCNQACRHCLRGYSENINIKKEYITNILEQIKYLEIEYDITFTGGEPTLNLSAIKHYISECERLNINHCSFYITTNGFKLNVDFAIICLKLYAMSDEKEMCQVQLSNDIQHEYIRDDDMGLMQGLTFFDKKHEEQKDYFQPNSGIILEGNAIKVTSRGRENLIYDFEDFEDWEDHSIYLNCKGNIINGCDWSYKNQDNNEAIFMCEVNSFTAWHRKHIRK